MQKYFWLIFLLLITQPAFSQFSYDEIKDESGFEFEEPLQFYWSPHFNRVEGFFLNGGAKLRPEKLTGFQFYGDAGVGFWNEKGKEFRFNAGARKDFYDFNRLSVGFDIFRKIESEDNWIIGSVENSLASFFFRKDYKDYYGIHGAKIYVDKKFKETHTARLEIERRTYDALKRNLDWSVFRAEVDENPTLTPRSPIVEGNELGLRLILNFDWRDNPIFPLSGWFVRSIYEHTEDDFDTDGLFLTVRRYQQTFSTHRMILSGWLGTRTGSRAEQHTIDLGGIGSLRAYDNKEFSGNRMVMFNIDYLFGGDILQRVPLDNVPVLGAIWTTLSLGLFVDSGMAVFTDVDDGLTSGFGDVFKNLETDFGVSLLVLDGLLRMDIARRTKSDRGKNDFRITFRLWENL